MDYKIKEIVTKEIIEQELKKEYALCIITLFTLKLFCFSACVILIIICKPFTTPNIITCVCLFLLCCLFLGLLIKCIIITVNYLSLNNNYSIVTDKLLTISFKKVHLFSKNTSNHVFSFENNGDFSMNNCTIYYQWSKLYCMTGKELEDSSFPSEEFYLVMVSKKIFCIYNKKMFELSDELKI